MTPALKTGKQFAFKVKAKNLVGQWELIAGEIVGKQSEDLLHVAAFQSLIKRLAFVWISESQVVHW
ncbi:hypothetical protein [uncultured Tateyamaria sp.]|uniref:hypothetical protein n=1 Tax=uncultured Tateyamaria sp. TaxID=455651 RepID=UPI00263809CF|nr:hypothetical protein [uncultured Tateyamaria sp.]